MEDLAVVNVLHRQADLHKVVEHLLLLQVPRALLLEQVREVSAVRKVHDNVKMAILEKGVAVAHNIRVMERGEQLDLLLRLVALLGLESRHVYQLDHILRLGVVTAMHQNGGTEGSFSDLLYFFVAVHCSDSRLDGGNAATVSVTALATNRTRCEARSSRPSACASSKTVACGALFTVAKGFPR